MKQPTRRAAPQIPTIRHRVRHPNRPGPMWHAHNFAATVLVDVWEYMHRPEQYRGLR